MTEPATTASPALSASPFMRWVERCVEPTDIAWLGAFRILFGLVMCTSMLRFLAFGWVDEFFVKPKFHFKYWGFAWVEPLPAPALHAFFWCMALLALGIAAGALFRLCACAFAVGFAYIQLLDVTTYLNHYYLANLLAVLLAVSPAHRVWSVDAWRTRKSTTTLPRGWLWLFRFQIGVVYTFAGLAKAQSDWLLHAAPLRIWLGSRTGMPLLGPLFATEVSASLMSWAGFLFDTSIAWLLLVSRIRPLAYCAVLVFHAVTGTLFPIGMFPVIMVLGALVFFPPAWPVRWRPIRRTVPTSLPATPPDGLALRFRPAVVTAALVYCVVQVAVPLRHWGYGGNVLWHEQGMRWSWRVMVREKNGSVTYVVRNARGNEWFVSPRRYLTRVQEREMSGQPDLILQLAHHIRDEVSDRLGEPVEVRADALASLNGRPLAPLVDPTVDLAKVEDGLGKASWIMQAPADAPPHVHPPAQTVASRTVQRPADSL
jgi:vitamin K-dependent gamma-carboxylase